MCGRYSLVAVNPAQLRTRFSLGERVELRRRFNVCPDDEVVAVAMTRDGEPRGDLLRWGFVPHWAQAPSSGAKMINARAETLAEKPAYRDAFARARCLILADGFYEWQSRESAPKLPWHVTRADGQPFAFAGLWSTWRDPAASESAALRTCTIVTTRAGRALADVHERMPVMLLDRDAELAWLRHETGAATLNELLAPPPDSSIARRPVSRAVNDANYDGPHCLDDADPADLAPTTLF